MAVTQQPSTQQRTRSRHLTPAQFALVSRAALWSLVAIVITGAAVRLTGSGLGCSSWPTCEPGKLVPAASFHGWVEFGNRLVTGAVSLAVIAAVSGAWLRSPRRANLLWWSSALVLGVAAQVGLGAVTVLTHLRPEVVMAHFGASMLLVVAATVLVWLAAREAPDGRGAGFADTARRPALAAWTGCVAGLTCVAVVTGTFVTASGPHGGDEDVARLGYELDDVTRVHAVSVIALVVLSLSFLGWLTGAARRVASARVEQVRRALVTCLVVMAAQASIGYVQYLNELPVVLVGLHIAGATALVVSVTRLVLTVALPTTANGSERNSVANGAAHQ